MPLKCLIHIRKEAYKFSCAHMTVFPDGSKERLHGHNYQVQVEIGIKQGKLSQMVEFKTIKDHIHSLADAWDEHVLLASQCPYLTIEADTKESLSFTLCNRRYLLPREEVLLLATDNISSENLAELFCRSLIERLSSLGGTLQSVNVRVDETNGQGASCTWTPGALGD